MGADMAAGWIGVGSRSIAAAFAAGALVACGPASGGDPELWAPVGHLGQGGGPTGTLPESGGGGGAAPGTAGGEPSMSFVFTTVSFNGKYAPDNVGAVWVIDGGGAFVKTLEVWGTKRLQYVEKWKSESGGSTVDAVTGATRSSHGSHEVVWDLKGLDGQVVADGPYQVVVEFTEHNAAGVWTLANLEKGTAPFEGAPPDTPYFVGQHLSFDPGQ